MGTASSQNSVSGIRATEGVWKSVITNYVLVAEDHDDTRFLLKTMLERQPGIKVVEAQNGEIASALAKVLRIDMVIVDRDLALLDGYAVTKRIREQAMFQNLPIIMMSDCAESSAQAKAREVGCDDYIVKPFSLSLLSTLLQRHLTTNCS
jgi:DNA-binding response OmpR family regulator